MTGVVCSLVFVSVTVPERIVQSCIVYTYNANIYFFCK